MRAREAGLKEDRQTSHPFAPDRCDLDRAAVFHLRHERENPTDREIDVSDRLGFAVDLILEIERDELELSGEPFLFVAGDHPEQAVACEYRAVDHVKRLPAVRPANRGGSFSTSDGGVQAHPEKV